MSDKTLTGPSSPQSYSPDGEWWWSGIDWKPAISADRRLRFDGEQWVRIARRSPFPVWSIAPTLIWFVLLGIWLPLLTVTFHVGNPTRDTAVWAIVGGSVVALATVTLGFVFGANRRALWLWLAIPGGSFAQAVGYFLFAESTAASYAPGGDISMGMGAFFLSIPIFLAVLIVTWVGAGIGRLVARKRERIGLGAVARLLVRLRRQ